MSKLDRLLLECSPPAFIPQCNKEALPIHLLPVYEKINHHDAIEDKVKLHNIKKLKNNKSLIIGFGGLNGLTLAALMNADAILMLDANSFQQEVYNELIFPLIKQCKTANEFRADLEKKINNNSVFSLNNGKSWPCNFESSDLKSESNANAFFHDPILYDRVRNIVINGEAKAALLNVFDTKRSNEIGEKLATNGYDVNAIYSTNIGTFVDWYRSRLTDSERSIYSLPKSNIFFNIPEDITMKEDKAKNYPRFVEALFGLSNGKRFIHFHADKENRCLACSLRVPQNFVSINSLGRF